MRHTQSCCCHIISSTHTNHRRDTLEPSRDTGNAHYSPFTTHNSQFTICLKCLLGGSCQTQTKLIYARHRQAGWQRDKQTERHTDRETKRHTVRQTSRAADREMHTLTEAKAKRLDPFWHLHLKELSSQRS